jgi:hypothetical protein
MNPTTTDMWISMVGGDQTIHHEETRRK